jgi:hypothetical protein
MGACGHNAAQAVLADLDSAAGTVRAPARGTGATRLDLVDRVASHPRLRGLRNWAMRQRALRGVISLGKRL